MYGLNWSATDQTGEEQTILFKLNAIRSDILVFSRNVYMKLFNSETDTGGQS